MASKRIKGISIAFTLAAVSACTPEGAQQSSSGSLFSFSEENSSSAITEESSIISSQSAESSFESSSDNKVYYLVSIYQSYPIRPDAFGRTGVRFDMSFNVEEGSPLYTNDEEMYALTDRFTPVFEPYGEAFSLVPLFYDEECTVFYVAGTPILSDSTFYYYMAG